MLVVAEAVLLSENGGQEIVSNTVEVVGEWVGGEGEVGKGVGASGMILYSFTEPS